MNQSPLLVATLCEDAMLLSDLMTNLSYNELSQHIIGNEGSGTIKPDYLGRVINQVNVALLELFTRFTVREKDLVVESRDWMQKYPLRKKYAVSDPTTGVEKFIIDTNAKPFMGDLISVISVSNEIGKELPLNDAEQYASVFTPQSDVLQLTHPGFHQVFFVVYKAKHPTILYNPEDIEATLAQEIEIPVCLEQPLRFRIAALIFSSMAGQDQSNKGQDLLQLYEKDCSVLEDNGLLGNGSLSTNVKLNLRGFV